MMCSQPHKDDAKEDADKMSDQDSKHGVGKRAGEFLILALYLVIDVFEIWPHSHIFALVAVPIGLLALLLLDGGFTARQNTIATSLVTLGCFLLYFVAPTPPLQLAPAVASAPVPTSAPAPEPTPMVGWLQPANEPTPENGCSSHGIDSPVVIMGDNGVMLGGVTKATALKVGYCALIGLQIGDNGASIADTIYDGGGRTIGEIENNRFSIPPADGLVIEKSGDLSTLVVHDGANQELLYVRYLNKTAFRIRGVFSCPSPHPLTVRITDTAISGAPMKMSCARWSGSGEAKGAAFSIQ